MRIVHHVIKRAASCRTLERKAQQQFGIVSREYQVMAFQHHQCITSAVIREAIKWAERTKPRKYHNKQRVKIMSESQLAIGIDPGVKTGIAVADDGKLQSVASATITAAMQMVLALKDQSPMVYIEDARKRTWFGNADARQARSGAGTREGVGSVKRDCGIWEQFCIEQGVAYQLVHPAANKTKLDTETFNRITGWRAKTNEHSRDAAMLVYQRVVKEVV